MKRLRELINTERSQYLAYSGVSIGVAILTGINYFSGNDHFERFIGGANTLIACIGIIVLGFCLLSFLISKGWFAIYKKENLKWLPFSAGLALIPGAIIILVDLKIIYPANMNVPFPDSLLFYPAIGFFVEVLFHVVPLWALMIILTSVFKNISRRRIIWIGILAVSLLEPIFQAASLHASNRYPLWAVVYTGFHVLLINVFQLLIFRRYDFISMYSFRLVYYLIWHIVWGYARLTILFK